MSDNIRKDNVDHILEAHERRVSRLVVNTEAHLDRKAKRIGGGIVAGLALLAGGAVVKHEISSPETAKVSANELAQIQPLRDPEVRAAKQADRTFVPVAGGDVFEITITDDKGNPERRLVHFMQPDENAGILAKRYGVPGEAGFFQAQGSGVVGDNGHELMTADPLLLPLDAKVDHK